MAWTDVRLPPNHPNRIGWACLLVSRPAAHVLLRPSCCPNDPHFILRHCLIYMIILNDYVVWYLGLTLGCLVPNVWELRNEIFFFLESSLQVKYLNNLGLEDLNIKVYLNT